MNSRDAPLPYYQPGGEPGDGVGEASGACGPLSEVAAQTPSVTEEERALVAESPTLCLNCGARLPGEFCPRCGQRNQALRVPVHHFVRDGLKEAFAIDGRVWRTFGTLLFKPGALTTEYVKGRRQRSLSPLRVYLITTVAFFVLLSLVDPASKLDDLISRTNDEVADTTVVVRDQAAVVDSMLAAAMREQEAGAAVDSSSELRSLERQYRQDSLAAEQAVERLRVARDASSGDARDALTDSLQAARDIRDDVGDVEDRLGDARDAALEDAGVSGEWVSEQDLQRLRLQAAILSALPPDSTVYLPDVYQAATQVSPNVELGEMPDWIPQSAASRRFQEARTGSDVARAGTGLLRAAISHLPTALFLLMPLFALLLKALYARRGWFYSEHLVFGLHVHAFAFAVLSVWMLVLATGVGGGLLGTLAGLLALTIPVYFLLAQKRVYGQEWVKTLVKSMALGVVYFHIVSALGVGIAVLLAIVRG